MACSVPGKREAAPTERERYESARSRTTVEAAVRTSEAIDAALEGYYGGRDDEFWTRAATWPGNAASGGGAQ